MENLMRLYHDWEIQFLVLLSFGIHIFLFFTGGLHRRSINMLLRFSIWIAYLGADMIAVYALGYLSQHKDATIAGDTIRGTRPLVFFWAPFLFIYLGGQDTITAFAMEDNNLWLRHLLNLVVQVSLCLSRALSSMEKGHDLSSVGALKVFRVPLEITVRFGREGMGTWLPNQVLKVLGIELGMMYDDFYTKALVLRTRSGITLRCISQLSALVAFVLFLACKKHKYSRADIAITYSLFVGSFFLELCALFIFTMSPWTWAWLKARKYDRLAQFSWAVLSNGLIGWPEKRPLWSNAMGSTT